MNKDNIELWYHKNIGRSYRTIYFGTWQLSEEMLAEDKTWEVNAWSAANLIKGLYVLNDAKKAPIKIIWFSFGGDYNAGMAIYDTIKRSKSPITMECYGRVRSMGTVILQACKKRLIAPNCLFLIHYGTSNNPTSHAKDVINSAEYDKKCNYKMESIYLKRIKEKHPRYTRAKLQELMKYDKYMNPHEAVHLGLADKVL